MRTKLSLTCAALFLLLTVLWGCVAVDGGGFALVSPDPTPSLRYGIYDLNSVACYYEDQFKSHAYAFMDESIQAATKDCKFPLNTEARIAEYGLCIQPILVESGLFREGLYFEKAVSYDDGKFIALVFDRGGISFDWINDGEVYHVLISAEDGDILLVTDNWGRTSYGNVQE